jgi:hypothetical protein
MAPTKLEIHTNSVGRLVKEEASYYREIADQEKKIRALESGDGSTTASNIDQEVRMLQSAGHDAGVLHAVVRT